MQIGKYLDKNLYMFISVFNYVCLKGCHQREIRGCWNEGRLVKLLTFCLPGIKFDQSFFESVSFVCFTQITEFAVQHMRNCVCKTQTATTGRQPVVDVCPVMWDNPLF